MATNQQKKQPSKLRHGRTVLLDAEKVSLCMNHRGWSVKDLASKSRASVGTIRNLLAERPIYRSSAMQIATALEMGLETLLRTGSRSATASMVHEYLVADVLTNWQKASNGLRFQVCRMRHLELDRQARGKRFDLRKMATDEAQRCRTWIKRHPNVCEFLATQPNVIRNLTAFADPDEGFYWVIDEWIEGPTLQQSLSRSSTLEWSEARRLLLDIAMGLHAMHDQGIIRRELNPASILLRADNGGAVLTELELSKLVDGSPTVSTDEWPVDPFRAPEAEGPDIDIRADVFSWAMIGLHALLDHGPTDFLNLRDRVTKQGLPSDVSELLRRAASPLRSERPSTINEIIPVIQGWH